MLVNVQITKHISLAEVVCHCRQCNEQNYNLAFLRRIDKFIRDEFEDAPIIIDRVCSCAAHNAFIGGAEHSRHLSYTPKDNSAQEQAKALQAFAIDIGAIQGYTIEQARVICNLKWFGGVEQNISWLHLDGGPNQRFSK